MQAIYAKRWSVARGWQIVKERECRAADSAAWLKVFQDCEPEIAFVVGAARKAPSMA